MNNKKILLFFLLVCLRLNAIMIGSNEISENGPVYIIAELSGNHGGDINTAKSLIKAAKEAGVSAVKLQTYTADTLTLNCRNEYFTIKNDGLWSGKNFYDLYKKAYTPWEWHKELSDYAQSLGVDLFSTPFDETAVDFLEETINPPAYKIASFELTHIPLLEKVAKTGKPVILSTGMGTEEEIGEAVDALKKNGCKEVVLLKCISNYPADPKDFNLKTLPALREKYSCLVGLSDHSIGTEVALGAVALGACVIEKHIVLDRGNSAVDAGFSSTPSEFKELVEKVRLLNLALGKPQIGPSKQEEGELRSRRSIFVSEDIKKGEVFTQNNLKIVRPADGLLPKYWKEVLGKKAKVDLKLGVPMKLEYIDE